MITNKWKTATITLITIITLVALFFVGVYLLDNVSVDAYQLGVDYGMEYAISTITSEALQCNQIPINYSNYSYTLIAIECLNINQGIQNG